MAEIKWGDARSASDHYRRCSDLRGERLRSLISTVRGRWDWIKTEALRIDEDNARVREEANRLFED